MTLNDYLQQHGGLKTALPPTPVTPPSQERGFLGNLVKSFSQSASKLPARIYAQENSTPGQTQPVHVPGLMGGMDVTPFQPGHTWENLKTLTGETLETALAVTPGLGEIGAGAKAVEIAGAGVKAAELAKGALAGKDVIEGANFIKNAYKVAKTGAKYGAAYGLATGLEQDHSVLQTLGDVIKQGVAGAAIGVGGHTILKGLGAGYRYFEGTPAPGTPGFESVAKGTNKSIEQHLNPYSHLSPEEVSTLTPEDLGKMKQDYLDEATLMKDAQEAWNTDQTAVHTPFTLAENAKTNAIQSLDTKLKTVGKQREGMIDNSPIGQKTIDIGDFTSQVGKRIKSTTASEPLPGGIGLGTAEAGAKIGEKHTGFIEKMLQDVSGLGKTPTAQEIDHLLQRWNDEKIAESSFDRGYPTTKSKAFMEVKSYLMKKLNEATGGQYSDLNNQYHNLSDLKAFLKSSEGDVSTLFDALEQTGGDLARQFDAVRQATGINLIATAKMARDAFQGFGTETIKSLKDVVLSSAAGHPPIGIYGKMRMGVNVFKNLLKTNKNAYRNTIKVITDATPEGAAKLNQSIASTRKEIAQRVAQLPKFKTTVPKVDKAIGAIKEFVKTKTGKDVPIENVQKMFDESAPLIKDGANVSSTPIGQALLEAVDFGSQHESQTQNTFQTVIDKIKGSYETYKAAVKQGVVAQLLESDGIPKEIIDANKLRIETALAGGGKNGERAFMKEIDALKAQLRSFNPSATPVIPPEAPVVPPEAPIAPPVETPPAEPPIPPVQ